MTARNPNPYDGESYYNLGIALRYLDKNAEAYDALYKATWNQAWRSASFLALAEIDATAKRWPQALEHAQQALRTDADNLNACALAVAAFRQLARNDEATTLLSESLQLDPLHCWMRYLADGTLPSDEQMCLDLAFDLIRAGFMRDAAQVLESGADSPMILYTLAHATGSAAAYRKARNASPDYCFPSRPEEMLVLEAAIRANPEDPRALYYLGNFFYARQRHRDAITCWERSVRYDPLFAIPWRNLGIAYFNVLGRKEKAAEAFDRAVSLNPKDARLVYERDQLWKRLRRAPRRRLAELDKRLDLVATRDDLSVELTAIYNQVGQPLKAQEVLSSRRFAPWEGGEGLVLGEYVRTQLSLARRALSNGDKVTAKRLLEAALDPPESLGEARHLLSNQSDVYYWLGVACEPGSSARTWFERAAESHGDFQEMSVRAASETTYYSALALKKLGRVDESRRLFCDLKDYALQLRRETPKVDYFATSLPAMLLFHDDLALRNRVTSLFLEAQARLGLGQKAQAQRLLKKVLALDRNHSRAADLSMEVNR
jgi:tetratricopeptide (TPR) repeat protein